MVRHDEDMFKIHPESMCRDDPAVTEMRNRGYYVRDVPNQTRVPLEPEQRVGLVMPVAPVNMSIDAKLNRVIELLEDIARMLK